ncbi:DUF3277 family protein, partial [Klebsiella pneumoniae]
MSTYSFIDVSASLTGPTGSIDLGYGSANSEEGITVVMAEAKNTMTVGADGEVMHSLHAGKSGMLWSSFFWTRRSDGRVMHRRATGRQGWPAFRTV